MFYRGCGASDVGALYASVGRSTLFQVDTRRLKSPNNLRGAVGILKLDFLNGWIKSFKYIKS